MTAFSYAAAASNISGGLFMGGDSGDLLSDVQKYDFATGAIANGTTLSKGRGYGGAASTHPGYL